MDEAQNDGGQPPELLTVGQPHCTQVLADTTNDDHIVQEINSSMNQHFETADDEQIHVSTSGFECGISMRDVPPRFESDTENQGSVVLQPNFEGRAVAVKVANSENRNGSKVHSAGVNKPTPVPSRDFYTSEDMRAIAQRAPPGWVNASHRDILFGLFLQSNASDFEDLAKKAGVKLVGRTNAKLTSNRGHAFRSEKEDTTLRPLKKSKVPLSLLSLVPLTLSKSTLSLSSCDHASSGTGQNRTDFHRPNLPRLSLSELEAKVVSKFEISSTGQNAIATENPQYTWFFKQIGKELSRPLVPQKKKTYTAMPIAYNECSMSAFAKWAVSSSDAHMHKDDAILGSLGALRTDFPSSTAMFHFCHICRYWGHFELECVDMSRPELRSVLHVEATTCQGLPGMEGHPGIDKKEYSRSSATFPRGCVFCKSCLPAPALVCNECASLCHPGCVKAPSERTYLVEWLCPLCEKNDKSSELDSVVELEGCEGYVIEQTNLPPNLSIGDTLSKSRGIDFDEKSWFRVLAILDSKVMTIGPKPFFTEPRAVPSKVVNEKQLLAVGDFCWAKRQHASIGMLGRDEWWPAQVIGIVANDLRQTSSDSVEVTPYLVKMLAISRASRVRATSTLPFLTNFRTVGYRRLSHQKNSKSYAEQRFRIGVEEVIDKMGFKTIDQALTQVDELRKTDRKSEHQMSLPAKRALPVNDENPDQRTSHSHKRARPDSEVTTFKQDGFVIHARASGKSEVLGATPHESSDLACGIHNGTKVYSRTKFPGCLVAWLSLDHSYVQMRVGTILAADIEAKMALVSTIPQWETKLRPARSKNGVVFSAYQTTVSEWMPMCKLHMITNGPERHFERDLSQSFVAKVLENARAKFNAEVAQKGSVSSHSSA